MVGSTNGVTARRSPFGARFDRGPPGRQALPRLLGCNAVDVAVDGIAADMIEMPVAVDQREMTDAGFDEVVPDPGRLPRARVRVVHQGTVAPVNHVGGHPDVHGAEIGPIVAAGRDARLGGPAVVEAEKMIIDRHHAHVHLGSDAGTRCDRQRQDRRQQGERPFHWQILRVSDRWGNLRHRSAQSAYAVGKTASASPV